VEERDFSLDLDGFNKGNYDLCSLGNPISLEEIKSAINASQMIDLLDLMVLHDNFTNVVGT
jgi:hypothetical protein